MTCKGELLHQASLSAIKAAEAMTLAYSQNVSVYHTLHSTSRLNAPLQRSESLTIGGVSFDASGAADPVSV